VFWDFFLKSAKCAHGVIDHSHIPMRINLPLGFPVIKWFFNNVLPFKLDYLVNLNIAFVFRLLWVMMFGLIKNGWFLNIFILDRPQ